MLKRYPKVPVILSTHQLLNIGPDGVSPLEVPYGLMLWEKLIKDNDQIFMTLNGHYHGAAHLTKTNDFGNPVEEMVVDYQMALPGRQRPDAPVRVDLTHNKIKIISFSPWVPQKPTETLNEFDVAVLTDKNQQFEIDFDFRKRLRASTPTSPFRQPATTRSTTAPRPRFWPTTPSRAWPTRSRRRHPTTTRRWPPTVAHWRFFGGTDARGGAGRPGHRRPDRCQPALA